METNQDQTPDSQVIRAAAFRLTKHDQAELALKLIHIADELEREQDKENA